jgi:hypothetical protein
VPVPEEGCALEVGDLVHRVLRSRGHPALDRVGGDAFDNALMATNNELYKAECIGTTVFHDGHYKYSKFRPAIVVGATPDRDPPGRAGPSVAVSEPIRSPYLCASPFRTPRRGRRNRGIPSSSIAARTSFSARSRSDSEVSCHARAVSVMGALLQSVGSKGAWGVDVVAPSVAAVEPDDDEAEREDEEEAAARRCAVSATSRRKVFSVSG